MKKQNTVDFSEIFQFAEKHFDMDWNTCNDVFFNTILKYKGYDEFDGDHYGHLDNVKTYADCKEDIEKAWYILQDFMKVSKLKTMLVLND